jgi:DNA-binding transcriptional ArsR family regulator
MVSIYLPIVKAHEFLLRALADPTRRKIFEDLRSGSRAVKELAANLPVSRPAVSQHLKVLKEAGLVRERRQGTRSYYSIDPRGLEPLRTYLESFWGEVLTAFENAVEKEKGGRYES